MDNLSPKSLPFDSMLAAMPQFGVENMRGALIDVHDTVDMAKRILLQNRVQQFTAADVVELTRIILERENVLTMRGSAE